ncbi:MAG: hypothetical protein AAGC46_03075 [Solirubrobacteraceae bacterium]
MGAPSVDDLDLERVLDLRGRAPHVWYRRSALLVLLAVVVVALTGAFGQVQHTRTVSGPAATLAVRSPSTVRGGLLVPTRIQITAKRTIASPQLILGPGFVRGMQINTLEPAATSETTRHRAGGDALALTYPTLDAGDTLTVYLQLQVDPTTVGSQDTSVELDTPGAAALRSPATLRVLP